MASIDKPITVSEVKSFLGQSTYNSASQWRGTVVNKLSNNITSTTTIPQNNIKFGDLDGAFTAKGAIEITPVIENVGFLSQASVFLNSAVTFPVSPGTNVGLGLMYKWTVPPNVTSISILAIGAGGDAYIAGPLSSGAGGGLAYTNNIDVVPGQTFTIQAGLRGGGGSVVMNDTTGVIVCGAYGGGDGSANFNSEYTPLVAGGTPIPNIPGQVGFNGGNAGRTHKVNSKTVPGGAGGAAGYTGNGGDGGDGKVVIQSSEVVSNIQGNAGSSLQGGGGGGGALRVVTPTQDIIIFDIGDGGGNNPYGLSGAGSGGRASSINSSGVQITNESGLSAGGITPSYGGGGSPYSVSTSGVVRIIWPGKIRQFPDKNVGNIDPPTINKIYPSAGTYTYTIPAFVTSISIIAVGSGASGISRFPGGGGALAWMKNISVSQGDIVTITLDSTNGNAGVKINNVLVIQAGGGQRTTVANTPSLGGSYYVNTSYGASRGGGDGGDAFSASVISGFMNGQGTAGGGAGGYRGKGGSTLYNYNTTFYPPPYYKYNGPVQPAPAGSGAGAYGTYYTGTQANPTGNQYGAGGGVGIYGFGETPTQYSYGGSGGNPGDNGSTRGGQFGGGGSGVANTTPDPNFVVRITTLDFPV